MTDTNFDTSVRPQDDYFGYINNKWIESNPIPPSESTWGTFYVLRDNAARAVRDLLTEICAAPEESLSHEQHLLKTYYSSAVEYDSHASNHHSYLKTRAAEIDALQSPSDIARYIGKMHRLDQFPFWAPYVDIDDKDSTRYVLRLQQSGLTLPNRDYYLDRNETMESIRTKYSLFYKLFTNKHPYFGRGFSVLMTFETKIAEHSWESAALRDIEKNYNKVTLKDLKIAYEFDWDSYFEGLGWSRPSDSIVIGQPSYIAEACAIIASTDIETLRNYLKWRLIDGVASWIDRETSQIVFDFFGTTLQGVTQQKPLWKRAVQAADSLILGEVIGKEYAQRYFPESSKQAVLDIVEDIRKSYHARIDKLTWMTDKTKARAHKKLDNISVYIGYPSVWKDISTLQLHGDNHLRLLHTLREFYSALELEKVGTIRHAEEWHMHAHTVNAYHHPNRLEIVFPAAILQPPFFDPTASYAANLGGIGAVTGHEFTHGFDDQGADFDEDGNTVRWQSEDERKAFDKISYTIVKQADDFETIPGTYLNGKLILGEAIADIGGLALAIESLESSSKPINNEDYHDLFVNFARCECAHMTDERALQLAKVDPHPPSIFRVNKVVCHIDAFYEAYDVKPTDKLYLEKNSRAQIW